MEKKICVVNVLTGQAHRVPKKAAEAMVRTGVFKYAPKKLVKAFEKKEAKQIRRSIVKH